MNEVAEIDRHGAFVVTTEPLLSEIYQLRYRRYVMEQGKSYPGAKAEGSLIDDEDRVSRQIAYYENGRLVSALRQTALRDISADGYLADLAVSARAACELDTIVCSRFVTENDKKGLRAIIALFRLAYEIGLDLGVRHSVLSTRESLVSLFETFGYRQTGATFEHSISGLQIVMRLDLLDTEYLDRVGSPLSRVARRREPGEALS